VVDLGAAHRAVDDFRALAGAQMRSQLEYRTSFWLLFTSSFVVNFVDVLGIVVVFQNTPSLGGWSVEQVFFLYGMSGLCFGVADFIVGGVETISPRVRDGSFDQILTRPVNGLVNLVATDFKLTRVGKIMQAAVVFVLAVVVAGVAWSPGRVLATVVAVVSGIALAGAAWVITASVSFWTVNTREVANSFTYGGATITQYPLHIFERWLRTLITYVIPLVFVNYLPALYILDVESPLNPPGWLRFASPLAAAVAVLAARLVWRAGLSNYTSTGS
jgi:ABC-2 type transport system permease protein